MRLAPWLVLALVGDLGASHVTLRPEIGLSVDRVRFVRGILPLMKLGPRGRSGVVQPQPHIGTSVKARPEGPRA